MFYKKLKNVGISNIVIKWFRTYLSRTQVLRYGDRVSDKVVIPAGIAQGTVLGPLMFIFYINDCINVLEMCLLMTVYCTLQVIIGMLYITHYKVILIGSYIGLRKMVYY